MLKARGRRRSAMSRAVLSAAVQSDDLDGKLRCLGFKIGNQGGRSLGDHLHGSAVFIFCDVLRLRALGGHFRSEHARRPSCGFCRNASACQFGNQAIARLDIRGRALALSFRPQERLVVFGGVEIGERGRGRPPGGALLVESGALSGPGAPCMSARRCDAGSLTCAEIRSLLLMSSARVGNLCGRFGRNRDFFRSAKDPLQA